MRENPRKVDFFNSTRPIWVRYAAAIFVTAVAVAARFALQPMLQERAPFITLVPGVAIVVFLAGTGPGIVSVVLSSVAAYRLFIPPEASMAGQGFNTLTWLSIFLATSGIIVAFGGALHASKARAESNLAQALANEERFRLMADASPAMIWMSGPDKLCTWFNKAWLNFTGRAIEKELGNGWAENVHPEDLKSCMQVYTTSFDARKPFEMEYRMRRHDGQFRWLLDGGVPMLGSSGEFRGYIGSCVDVTESRLKREELERIVADRTARLSEMVGELEAFSYSVAHDMRAPLRGMQGFANVLLEEFGPRLESQAVDYLNRIVASARRLDLLIQDVLNYSKIVRSELPLEAVDVGRLVQGIVDSYPELQAPKAEIRIEGPLPLVWGNQAALTQVISNLLGNAVKFVGPGIHPQVRISGRQENGMVRLWFEDNGIGIPEEFRGRIFQIFQRLHSPDTYEGTGIGLAIVRKAVERMGGKVGVESAPTGSRFWVELKPSK